MSVCSCNVTLGNTGTPNCYPVMGVTKKAFIVPYYDDAGSVNRIDLSTLTFDQTYLDGKINATDDSQRWFPLPEFKNVEDVKGDSLTESFNDGSVVFIQEGARTFNAVMLKQSSVFLGKLKEARCTEIGVFFVDQNGNFIGSQIEEGFLYPIKIDENTWNPVLMKSTDTTIQKIMLSFEFDRNELDENLRMITANSITADLLNSRGLLDVNAAYSAISTTGFTATMTLDYGNVLDPLKFKGAVLADFTLYNETTAASVVITSVTESSDGVYDFVIPAQTSADVMTLTLSKNGYELYSSDVTVTIP